MKDLSDTMYDEYDKDYPPWNKARKKFLEDNGDIRCSNDPYHRGDNDRSRIPYDRKHTKFYKKNKRDSIRFIEEVEDCE